MKKSKSFSFLIGSIVLLTLPNLLSGSPERAGISMTGLKTRIETPSLQESISFYSELLGMTVLDSWDDDGDKGAILGVGSTVGGEAFLELGYVETARSYEGISLQFRVQDIYNTADKLRDQWDFEGPVERPWGSKYMYLEDPTGVQVILYEGEL